MPSSRPLRLGILVPSSNTAVEPITISLLASLPPNVVTVHFSRIRVTQISASPTALSQFSHDAFLGAASLLADAKMDVIGWSGTAGGWLGFEDDEKLCAEITEATGGIPATTSTLALNRILEKMAIKDIAFVTPYVDEVQSLIIENYSKAGYVIHAESHLGFSDNAKIAEVSQEMLSVQLKEVMGRGNGKVKAITTFCTNLRAAQWAQDWENEYGVPILDTVVTVVWDMLRLAGETGLQREVKGWGTIFEI